MSEIKESLQLKQDDSLTEDNNYMRNTNNLFDKSDDNSLIKADNNYTMSNNNFKPVGNNPETLNFEPKLSLFEVPEEIPEKIEALQNYLTVKLFSKNEFFTNNFDTVLLGYTKLDYENHASLKTDTIVKKYIFKRDERIEPNEKFKLVKSYDINDKISIETNDKKIEGIISSFSVSKKTIEISNNNDEISEYKINEISKIFGSKPLLTYTSPLLKENDKEELFNLQKKISNKPSSEKNDLKLIKQKLSNLKSNNPPIKEGKKLSNLKSKNPPIKEGGKRRIKKTAKKAIKNTAKKANKKTAKKNPKKKTAKKAKKQKKSAKKTKRHR